MTNYFDSLSQATLNHASRKLLDRYLEGFLQCLWPDVHRKIDWNQSFESLKWQASELSQGLEAVKNADLVYQVTTLNQENCLLWIHIAFSQEQPGILSKRLFQLSHQLYSHYQQPVLPLVLSLEVSSDWNLESYQANALGYPTHRFEFQTASLSRWLGQENQLLSSNNPFEKMIGIYLKAQTASADIEARYQLKLELHSCLLQNTSNKEEFLDVYAFMDQCLFLPGEYNKRYHQSVYELERKQQLDYLISSEQFGIDQWIQKGFQEGEEQANRKHIKRMLSANIDRASIKNILRITDQELNRLLVLETDDTAQEDDFETVVEN